MEWTVPVLTQQQVGQDLQRVAVLYVVPRATDLELLLMLPSGGLVVRRVTDAVPEVLQPTADQFLQAIPPPTRALPAASASPLHQWLIVPLEAALQAEHIQALIFCARPGLRTVPFAALHDGQQFLTDLTEKYAVGRMPAYSLTNHDRTRLPNLRVLAIGASEFFEHPPLPAVPVEPATITT